MSKIIGIDFGTTNSVVSVWNNGEPVVIANAEGSRITPSVVNGDLVGAQAKRYMVSNPAETFTSIKRLIGERHMAVEISAKILKKLKADAENYLGESVTKAVIAVPVLYNENQRRAIRDAARIAGIEILRFIGDSTAAALAYGLDKDNDETILVFDLGGGSLSVSIIELTEGTFDVQAINGDNRLGGDDFDRRIFDWIVAEFRHDAKINLAADKVTARRVIEAAEKAKIELSTVTATNINLPFIAQDTVGWKNLDLTLTRRDFYELTRDLIQRIEQIVTATMKNAGLAAADIDKVILVGGTSRIPDIQIYIHEIFGRTPAKCVNPDEAVAIGAAIRGGVNSGEIKDILLLDVMPYSFGIETNGGICTKILERNTIVPTQKSQIFSTVADNQTSIEINIMQGESEFADDNLSLGKIILEIPPLPRGVTQIEVTFDIDANGIINVSAKDKGTGAEQKFTTQTGNRNIEIQN